jgi:DNA-binding NarL/FixJ family response regulator
MTMTAEAQNRPGLTILLLDDNRVFAEVLAMRLSEQPEVKRVVVVATAQEALTWLSESHADLLLVDHQASGGDQTLEVMRGLSTLPDRPAVLVLSSESDHRAVMAAFESGVRGWATTDYSFATLWTAVREVASGHMVLYPPAVEPIVVRLLEAVRAEKRAERRDFVSDLSPREYEVLRCLVAGMTKKEVAQRLFLSVNTVRTHVQHLLRAADVHTTLALVAAARELDVTGIDDGR